MNTKKTVLITGGAGGIGLASAKIYLASGYRVICHFHHQEPDITGVEKIQGDFSSDKGVDDFISELTCKEIQVDVLVNNAASFHIADNWSEVTSSQFAEVFQVNTMATFKLSQHAARDMLGKKWGRIVNISSISVEHGGNPASVAYTTSKAAIEAITKSISKETARFGILINALRVGMTDTNFHRRNQRKSLSDRVAQIPIGRMASADEIAATIFFYGSDENTFTTGTVIKISGGE